MVLDLVFLILIVLYCIKGYRKGLLVSVISFLAIIIGFIIALKFSQILSGVLFDNNSVVSARWAPLITFILIIIIVVWVMRFIASSLSNMTDKLALGWINRLSGALVYGLIITFCFSTFLWLANKSQIINRTTLDKSISYALIAPIAPIGFEMIGKAIPFVKGAYESLSHTLDKAKATVQQDVDTHR